LIPYYGQPWKSRNEIDRGQPKQGTTPFHAYATACIVQYGQRYTLALAWVRRHESTVTVLRRLLTRLREIAVNIEVLLRDRAFFSAAVMAFLQAEHLPCCWPKGAAMTVRLELLRFKQLLDWINQAVLAILHDGSMPCVTLNK
jgi:hypothetical protein